MTLQPPIQSNPTTTIRPRDRDALIQSLRSGVVPKSGQHLVQVGRFREIEALIKDIDRISDGGGSFRLVIGEYGAGKTFFLNLVRSMCLEKKLVVCAADLNPDRRLHASGGQARSLYSELMRNLATRAKPDGNALAGIVEKFISNCTIEAQSLCQPSTAVIARRLQALTESVNGFDFSSVVQKYCEGFETGNEGLKQDAIRWLRAEFSTKTEARAALGVRSIIEDDTVYDHLKLMARFVSMAGFAGLMVSLDEMVNLYKLQNKQARESNYEQILRILNDSLQGGSQNLGFIMGGTPDFLSDPRRGLFSYQALQSRLAHNAFVKDKMVDYTGPTISLAKLDQNDFYVLLRKIRDVYVNGDAQRLFVSDDEIKAFMAHCADKVGEQYFKTPRTTIRSFIDALAAIEQNPGVTWEEIVGKTEIQIDNTALSEKVDQDAEFADFKL